LLACAAGCSHGCSHGPSIALPGGGAGIGFDDLRWSPRLGHVLAPAGRTGNLDLVDPDDDSVTAIGGFSATDAFDGGHDFGVTSADDTGAWLLATDRTSRSLGVVDARSGTIVTTAPVGSGPDYVRWVASTNEAWVTEPGSDRLELFRLTPGAAENAAPMLEQVGTIAVAGGPESLVIDLTRNRAYTHLWSGATVAIDLTSRAIVATWPNGCKDSRGIALDEPRGILFAGCREGKATSLDVTDGHKLGEVWPVDGIDVIDYDPALHHLYLAGQIDATLAIVGVTTTGEMAVLGTASTAIHAHCVVSAGHGRIFVCDPDEGKLLVRDDPYDAIQR
jgi:hypothetical protein